MFVLVAVCRDTCGSWKKKYCSNLEVLIQNDVIKLKFVNFITIYFSISYSYHECLFELAITLRLHDRTASGAMEKGRRGQIKIQLSCLREDIITTLTFASFHRKFSGKFE